MLAFLFIYFCIWSKGGAGSIRSMLLEKLCRFPSCFSFFIFFGPTSPPDFFSSSSSSSSLSLFCFFLFFFVWQTRAVGTHKYQISGKKEKKNGRIQKKKGATNVLLNFFNVCFVFSPFLFGLRCISSVLTPCTIPLKICVYYKYKNEGM
jgi:ABC-type Fe3+ transport system permease subunit